MSQGRFDRAVTWLFGEDGGVIAEDEVQVMTVASAALVLNTLMLSPILADLTGPFSVSETRIGLLVTAVTAPAVVVIPIMGVLADRFGRKALLVPGLIVFGAAGAAIGFVDSFRVALALRFVQGIGYAAAMPITVILLGDIYEGSREATAQGLRTAGLFVVSTLAPWVAGLLVVHSWRYPFALYAATIPVALWAWRAMPDVVPDARVSFARYGADLARLLGQPLMALLLVSFALRFFVIYGFFTAISIYAHRTLDISVVLVGTVVGLKSLSSMVSSMQAGRTVHYLPPALVVAGAFAVSGLGLALAGFVPSVAVLVLGTLALGLGDGLIAPLQKSLVTEHTPTRYRAGAMSLSFSFQNVGKAVAPLAIALVLVVGEPATVFVSFGLIGAVLGSALSVAIWRVTA